MGQAQVGPGGTPAGTWNPGQSYYGSDPSNPLISARAPTGYVWTPQGLKTVWEANGSAPPDYRKFVEDALGRYCVADRVYPGQYDTVSGLLSGLEGLVPRHRQKWRTYGLPLYVPSFQISRWCTLTHPIPVATVYRYMPTALATHFLLIRDAGPVGTGLPFSNILGGTTAVLCFLVQKYTPFGPVLHEPYTNGLYMVQARFTVPLLAAVVVADVQNNVVEYDSWDGTRHIITLTEFSSSTLPMFDVARGRLYYQYPTLAIKLLGMRYDDRTPEQVQAGWFPPPPLLAPPTVQGQPPPDEESQSV